MQDTTDTEFKLPCLFLMWPFRSYFQFDMKAHVSQLKCELSDYILFLMWSHHTGNTWKILWIQDLNFMLVYNMNYQLILPFWYEVTCFTTEMWTYRLYSLFEMKSPHWKHLHDTLDTEFTFDMNSQVFNSIIVFAIAWFVTFLLMPLNFGWRQHWSGHKHFYTRCT